MTDETNADAENELSAKQLSKLKEWLDEKTKNIGCPVCGNQTWSLGTHLLDWPVYDMKKRTQGAGGYPQAFVACTNCYYVRSFMAAPIGIAEPDGEAGSE